MDNSLADNINASTSNVSSGYTVWILGRLWHKLHWRWLGVVLGRHLVGIISSRRNSLVP